MENIKSLWARIILTSFKNVDRLISSLDRTIDCVAMQGFSTRRNSLTTQQIADKIIELSYRKQGLINLKVIAFEIIKIMRKEYVDLIDLKFNKGKKFHEIASELKISLRSAFRYYDKALTQFACYLKLKGYTDEMLEKEYKGEPYIDKIKAKIYEEYRDLQGNEDIKLKKVINSLNIICGSQARSKASR